MLIHTVLILDASRCARSFICPWVAYRLIAVLANRDALPVWSARATSMTPTLPSTVRLSRLSSDLALVVTPYLLLSNKKLFTPSSGARSMYWLENYVIACHTKLRWHVDALFSFSAELLTLERSGLVCRWILSEPTTTRQFTWAVTSRKKSFLPRSASKSFLLPEHHQRALWLECEKFMQN